MVALDLRLALQPQLRSRRSQKTQPIHYSGLCPAQLQLLGAFWLHQGLAAAVDGIIVVARPEIGGIAGGQGAQRGGKTGVLSVSFHL